MYKIIYPTIIRIARKLCNVSGRMETGVETDKAKYRIIKDSKGFTNIYKHRVDHEIGKIFNDGELYYELKGELVDKGRFSIKEAIDDIKNGMYCYF